MCLYFSILVAYEITIVMSDKKEGGMMHNAWLILEGDKKKSREFLMKNSPVHKVFRKGCSDTFTLDGRYLGKLKKVILGAVQREDKPLGKIFFWSLLFEKSKRELLFVILSST